MNRIYKSTCSVWNPDGDAPDPVPPELDGCECVLDDTRDIPMDDGQVHTVWTWHCYKIEQQAFGDIMKFTRVAPESEIAGLEGDSEGKGGKLLRAQAKREGDRVVLDFAIEVDAENLKRVLPMVAPFIDSNPAIPAEWKEQLDDFFAHVRTAVDGGAA